MRRSQAEGRNPVLLSGGGIRQDRIGRATEAEVQGQMIDENWIAGLWRYRKEGGVFIP